MVLRVRVRSRKGWDGGLAAVVGALLLGFGCRGRGDAGPQAPSRRPGAKAPALVRHPRSFPDAPPVTVGAILTHASGPPRESDFPYWSAPDYPFPTREQVIERLRSQIEPYLLRV